MFRRNVDTAPPLPVADETSNEHGASLSWRPFEKVHLVFQEPFVCIAGATEVVADASDLV